MNDIAVRVEEIGKCFELKTRPDITIEEAILRRLKGIKRKVSVFKNKGIFNSSLEKDGKFEINHTDFWALRNISFELNHGEVLGIIGPNGAGKSTLLKILSQVLVPTEGRVELHGRVGALLEVGTGFSKELSGRENIYLYGSILGMDKVDIAKRFDEIVAFAEIEKFLDQPIKNYSSGMHSRLAFSVAAHLECDILLVDEVLAVGDASFRNKCLGKMQDVTGQGRAVIFVSHNMSAIRNMCSTALVLQNGRVKYSGMAAEAIEYYMRSVSVEKNEILNPVLIQDDAEKEVKIREVYIKNKNGDYNREIEYIEKFKIGMKVHIKRSSLDYYNTICLQDYSGNIIIFSTDEDLERSLISQQPPGVCEFSVSFPGRLLAPGDYRVIWETCHHVKGQIDRYDNLIQLSIKDTYTWRGQRGLYRRGVAVAPELEWTASSVETDLCVQEKA